jgi:hypothetical protein
VLEGLGVSLDVLREEAGLLEERHVERHLVGLHDADDLRLLALLVLRDLLLQQPASLESGEISG